MNTHSGAYPSMRPWVAAGVIAGRVCCSVAWHGHPGRCRCPALRFVRMTCWRHLGWGASWRDALSLGPGPARPAPPTPPTHPMTVAFDLDNLLMRSTMDVIGLVGFGINFHAVKVGCAPTRDWLCCWVLGYEL